MVKTVGKLILLSALFGALLYTIVYFMASNGEAYGFAEKAIKNSHAIKLQVGEIQHIRLNPFGYYNEKTVGSEEWVSMTIEIVGTEKTAELHIDTKNTNGTWAIEQAHIDGKPVIF